MQLLTKEVNRHFVAMNEGNRNPAPTCYVCDLSRLVVPDVDDECNRHLQHYR